MAHTKPAQRTVALKIFSPTFNAAPSFIKRFQREARTVARLNDQSIVQMHDIGEEEELHFFSMEYMEGRTLGKVLEEKVSLNADEVDCKSPQQAQGEELDL